MFDCVIQRSRLDHSILFPADFGSNFIVSMSFLHIHGVVVTIGWLMLNVRHLICSILCSYISSSVIIWVWNQLFGSFLGTKQLCACVSVASRTMYKSVILRRSIITRCWLYSEVVVNCNVHTVLVLDVYVRLFRALNLKSLRLLEDKYGTAASQAGTNSVHTCACS